ncbi:diacylglycerol/lipid kinase family protein [Hutsoniella sourekii]
MKKAMIIVNPSSGQEEAVDYAHQLEKVLQEQFDHVSIEETQAEGDASALAKEACDKEYAAIYLLGGDGTINEGITGLADQSYRPAIGLLPLGTKNNFARMLDYPMAVDQAIEALRQPVIQEIDLGTVGNQYIISSVSIGALPESVQEVDSDMKTKWGPLAYAIKGLQSLGQDQAPTYRLEVDGVVQEEAYELIVIGLGNSIYGLESFFSESSLGDGYLQMLAVKESSALESLSMIPEFFKEKKSDNPQMTYLQFKEATISIDDSQEHYLTVDGDQGPALPCRISIVHDHLKMIKPQKEGI